MNFSNFWNFDKINFQLTKGLLVFFEFYEFKQFLEFLEFSQNLEVYQCQTTQQDLTTENFGDSGVFGNFDVVSYSKG